MIKTTPQALIRLGLHPTSSLWAYRGILCHFCGSTIQDDIYIIIHGKNRHYGPCCLPIIIN
jgi:hypothetical protein